VFLIEMNKKKINIPKVLRFSWLKAEGFEILFQQLKHKRVNTFLELSRKIYPGLENMFSTTWSSKMICCCQVSRESAWISTRWLGRM